MAEKLTLARLKELLKYDPETGVFKWVSRRGWRAPAGAEAGTINHHGRRAIMVDQKLYTAHRLAWFYTHGRWPKDQIDHINCDPTDNRLANLREATSSQNKHNQRLQAKNSTGFKGVYFHKRAGRYAAQITANKQHKFVGLFDTPEEAHTHWLQAARELHGDFARAA